MNRRAKTALAIACGVALWAVTIAFLWWMVS